MLCCFVVHSWIIAKFHCQEIKIVVYFTNFITIRWKSEYHTIYQNIVLQYLPKYCHKCCLFCIPQIWPQNNQQIHNKLLKSHKNISFNVRNRAKLKNNETETLRYWDFKRLRDWNIKILKNWEIERLKHWEIERLKH